IIQITMHKNIDKTSIHYSRMVVHLQFFLQRLLQNEMLQSNDRELYHFLKRNVPHSVECACKISDYVKQRVKQTLSIEEIVYLATHISRVFGENTDI
ncbi:MAG: PRD domain-containing protein, partial [Hespellia sp.]|nr:PRD domain-containing protein [Hespellia sp.]